MALQPLVSYGVPDIPDPLAAFQQGQLFRQQQEAKQAAKVQADKLKAAMASLPANPSASDIRNLIIQNPQLSEVYKTPLEMLTADEKQAKIRQALPVVMMYSTGNADKVEEYFKQQAEAFRNAGDEESAKRADMQAATVKANPLASQIANSTALAEAMGLDKFVEVVGGMQDNYKAQMLTPLEIKEKTKQVNSQAAADNIEVQQVKIYPNGTSLVVGKDGRRQVRNPAGDVLTGAYADDALARGLQSEITVAGGRAGAEARARAGVELATAGGIEATKVIGAAGAAMGVEAAKALTKASAALVPLRRARELVASGEADTGVIASKFPNWSAGAVELSNLRNQLGLDVIGAAAFGALSEGELNLALDTALPVGLDKTQLTAWLDRKIAAQEKLRTELSKAAKFLTKEGNTLNMWLEQSGNAPAAPSPAAVQSAAAAELARRRAAGAH